MHKLRLLPIVVVLVMSWTSGGCFAAQLCPTLPPRSPMPKEALPAPVEIPDWHKLSAAISAQVASRDLAKVSLVFVGDSITQGWEPTMWNLFWSAYDPLNLGLSGDLTQGVLWRLHNGQWPAALKPDVVVLLIGTNNASWHSRAEDTALGIAEIIRLIHARSPATKVLLLGILPRGPTSATPERPISQHVNALVRQCADNQTVFYAEPGDAMVDASGRISNYVMFDYLHPTMVGYAILGGGIHQEVKQLMRARK